MTATVVQVKSANPSNTGCSITLDSAPTVGNMLIAICAQGTPTTAVLTANTNWNYVTRPQVLIASLNGGIFYKVAGVGESTTQTPVSGGRTNESVTMFEVTGLNGAWAEVYQPLPSPAGGQVLGTCNVASNYDADPCSWTATGMTQLLLFSSSVFYLFSSGAVSGDDVAIPLPVGLDTLATGQDNNTTDVAVRGGYKAIADGATGTVTMTWNNVQTIGTHTLCTVSMLVALQSNLVGGVDPTLDPVTVSTIVPAVTVSSFKYTTIL